MLKLGRAADGDRLHWHGGVGIEIKFDHRDTTLAVGSGESDGSGVGSRIDGERQELASGGFLLIEVGSGGTIGEIDHAELTGADRDRKAGARNGLKVVEILPLAPFSQRGEASRDGRPKQIGGEIPGRPSGEAGEKLASGGGITSGDGRPRKSEDRLATILQGGLVHHRIGDQSDDRGDHEQGGESQRERIASDEASEFLEHARVSCIDPLAKSGRAEITGERGHRFVSIPG